MKATTAQVRPGSCSTRCGQSSPSASTARNSTDAPMASTDTGSVG